ncbi:MAG: Gfo/Idh/MocA family oxidoreductase [Robiginitomaculum sp.]|nr:Gfo/Idh/MocA family oxidoreductase [Robiginitomaculum sp.]
MAGKGDGVGVAVIGCGHWGKNLVRNFSTLGALVAVVDPRVDIAAKFAQEYGVKALSLDEALVSDDISAMVIAVPAELHAKIALGCHCRGQGCLCRKAGGPDYGRCQRHCRCCQRGGSYFDGRAFIAIPPGI